MQAKQTVVHVEEIKDSEDNITGEVLTLEAIYNANNPEDNSYAEATPSFSSRMYIENKVLLGRYPEGTQFKVTFEPTFIPEKE
jgi:hypothetical protein